MAVTREKAQLMSASEIDRSLVRLAHEILEKGGDLEQMAFVGIRRRGVPLAQRLARKIEALEKRPVPVGILDINLYRDDLTTVDIKPVVNATEIPFSVHGKDIILMDDVGPGQGNHWLGMGGRGVLNECPLRHVSAHDHAVKRGRDARVPRQGLGARMVSPSHFDKALLQLYIGKDGQEH